MSDISKLQEKIDFEIKELGVSPSSPRIKAMKKELAALKKKEKDKDKLPKGYKSKGWNADGTMDVMGGYVLDMKQGGKIIGTRMPDGSIKRNNPGAFLPCKAVRIKRGKLEILR